jgi:hypothetical protein
MLRVATTPGGYRPTNVGYRNKPLPPLPASANSSPMMRRKCVTSSSTSSDCTESQPALNVPLQTTIQTPHPIDSHQQQTTKEENLSTCPWYFGPTSREECKRLIESMRRDGTFVVRDSQRGGRDNPYALSVSYGNTVYNLLVRLKPNRKFALGTEKPDEPEFNTVSDLVDYHRREPIYLASTGGSSSYPADVCLTINPMKPGTF